MRASGDVAASGDDHSYYDHSDDDHSGDDHSAPPDDVMQISGIPFHSPVRCAESERRRGATMCLGVWLPYWSPATLATVGCAISRVVQTLVSVTI